MPGLTVTEHAHGLFGPEECCLTGSTYVALQK